ncbi:MAG: hypothetical protein J3Q66DRAFT_436213 [Benniella sp.]|nr:MAG: hypothetical protein J3Q66DRAFT_436213 [Benniella sp.]
MEDMPQDSASEGMLENSAPENMLLDLAPEDMLLDYCERLTLALVPEETVLPSQFSQSKSIFLDHHEDLVETIPSSNSAIDVGSKNMARDVKRFLEQYANSRRKKGSGVSSTVASSSSLMTPDRSSASGTTAASRPVEPSNAPSTDPTPVTLIVQDSTPTTATTAYGPTELSGTSDTTSAPLNNAPSRRSGRGYRKFMSQNEFRAKVCQNIKPAEIAPSTASLPKRKRNGKRKPRATLYDKATKKHRANPQRATSQPTTQLQRGIEYKQSSTERLS